MNNSIRVLIEKYISEQKYKECNEILIKEIIYIFVKKIQELDNTFLYSTLLELVESAKEYLTADEAFILKSFYRTLNLNYSDELLLKELIEIYDLISKNYED